MNVINHTISNKNLFEKQLLTYFKDKKNVVFLNSNDVDKINLFAVSNNNGLDKNKNQFGFISYDYKNKIEELFSNHFDGIQFPEKHFFTPELLFKLEKDKVEIVFSNDYLEKIEVIISEIEKTSIEEIEQEKIEVLPKISKEDYLKTVTQLKEHIQLGDIYEVNYCQEYFSEKVEVNPIDIYIKLNKKSPTPFSCFVKCDKKIARADLCSSVCLRNRLTYKSCTILFYKIVAVTHVSCHQVFVEII